MTMDFLASALHNLGIDGPLHESDPMPHLAFLAKLDHEDAKNTTAEVFAMAYPSREAADEAARKFCEHQKPFCALAWTVPADMKESSWHWSADRFGSADLWRVWGEDRRSLPGASYVANFFRATQPPSSPVARIAIDYAADALTADRAVAAADVLSLFAPHLGTVQPADLGRTDPPRGLETWRLPPGERPLPKSEDAQGEGRLDRVREIMRAPAYDRDARPGKGATIAVLDTGIKADHPAFSGAIVRAIDATGEGSADRDTNGHGTWCAGAIGGIDVTDESNGFRGLAAGCSIVAIKVLTSQGWGTDAMIARGIEIAISAKVDGISMSLGGSGEMPRTRAAIKLAAAAGIPITAAAGNEGPADGTVGYPGAYPEVECVGALTLAAPPTIARFSSRGNELDVCAPGEAVYGPWSGNRYTRVSGTSMATPYTAAARLLCRAEREKFPVPDRCPVSTADLAVYDTAYRLDGWEDRPNWYGQGCVNIAGAVKRVQDECQPKTPVPPPPPPPPSSGDTFHVGAKQTAAEALDMVVMALSGVESRLSKGYDVLITVKASSNGG